MKKWFLILIFMLVLSFNVNAQNVHLPMKVNNIEVTTFEGINKQLIDLGATLLMEQKYEKTAYRLGSHEYVVNTIENGCALLVRYIGKNTNDLKEHEKFLDIATNYILKGKTMAFDKDGNETNDESKVSNILVILSPNDHIVYNAEDVVFGFHTFIHNYK